MDDKQQTQSNEVVIPSSTNHDDLENLDLIKAKKKVAARFLNSPRFQEWYRLFYDKDNKDTFGNSTQSAIRAYKLDPIVQYESAMVMGSQNLRKLKNVSAQLLHKKGVTYNSMMDVGFNKMLKSSSPDMWFMFMEMAGYPVPEYKPVTNPVFIQNQTNNQFNSGNSMSVSFAEDDPKKEGEDFEFPTESEVIDGAVIPTPAEDRPQDDQADTSPVPDSDRPEQV